VEARAPKVHEASFVHRLFRLTPGHAPDWAYACCGGCEGGVVMFAAVGLVVAAIAAGKAYGWWWAVAVAVPAAVGWLVVMGRFADRERFGRARVHRGECVWCGQPGVPPGSACPGCCRSAEPGAAADTGRM
jgi:hypothetical protein